MKTLKKYYDMMTDGSVGAYKDQDGDWVEYFIKPIKKVACQEAELIEAQSVASAKTNTIERLPHEAVKPIA